MAGTPTDTDRTARHPGLTKRMALIAKDRCVFRAQLGLEDLDESVCVTPTRQQKLFGSVVPSRIGCGSFACAYDGKEKGTVVKFTSDPSDVVSLQKAGPKYAPRVLATYRLNAAAKKGPWAIVAERLQPTDSEWQRIFDPAIMCVRKRGEDQPGRGRRKGEKWQDYRKAMRNMSTYCCKEADLSVIGDNDKESVRAYCRTTLESILEIREGLRLRGINWWDIAGRNIGWSKRDKRWKALDLGMTGKTARGVAHLRGTRR